MNAIDAIQGFEKVLSKWFIRQNRKNKFYCMVVMVLMVMMTTTMTMDDEWKVMREDVKQYNNTCLVLVEMRFCMSFQAIWFHS